MERRQTQIPTFSGMIHLGNTNVNTSRPASTLWYKKKKGYESYKFYRGGAIRDVNLKYSWEEER